MSRRRGVRSVSVLSTNNKKQHQPTAAVEITKSSSKKRPAEDKVESATSIGKKPSKRAKSEAQAPQLPESVTGTLYTFGTNICGQLGFAAEKRKFPALVPILHETNIAVRQVAAGGMHTVVLTDSGKVYTFGCNDEGALGRSTSETNDEELESLTPIVVSLPKNVIQVTAGSSHSAALTEDGDVFCWGTFRDSSGKFGLLPGSTNEQEHVPMKLRLEMKIRLMASGNDHMVLLTEEGKVLTFGSCKEALGRLFPRPLRHKELLSDKDEMLTPKGVHFHGRKKFSHIWAGSSTTFCREATKAAGIWAFGMNSMKQLGIEGSEKEVMVALPTKSPSITELNFSQIAIGEFHCLGLTPNGKVYSWGRPDDGQLGLGTSTPTDPISIPTQVSSLSEKIIRIACGHSVSYAVTEHLRLYAWGFGENWQLGYGEEDEMKVPRLVLAKIRGDPAKNVRLVAGGGQHVCLVAEYGLGMAMETN